MTIPLRRLFFWSIFIPQVTVLAFLILAKFYPRIFDGYYLYWFSLPWLILFTILSFGWGCAFFAKEKFYSILALLSSLLPIGYILILFFRLRYQ